MPATRQNMSRSDSIDAAPQKHIFLINHWTDHILLHEMMLQALAGLQKTFECPICLDLLSNPVATRCQHKFCRYCLTSVLGNKPSAPCPLCKEKFTKRSLMSLPKWNEIVKQIRVLVASYEKDVGSQYVRPQGPVSCSPAVAAQGSTWTAAAGSTEASPEVASSPGVKSQAGSSTMAPPSQPVRRARASSSKKKPRAKAASAKREKQKKVKEELEPAEVKDVPSSDASMTAQKVDTSDRKQNKECAHEANEQDEQKLPIVRDLVDLTDDVGNNLTDTCDRNRLIEEKKDSAHVHCEKEITENTDSHNESLQKENRFPDNLDLFGISSMEPEVKVQTESKQQATVDNCDLTELISSQQVKRTYSRRAKGTASRTALKQFDKVVNEGSCDEEHDLGASKNGQDGNLGDAEPFDPYLFLVSQTSSEKKDKSKKVGTKNKRGQKGRKKSKKSKPGKSLVNENETITIDDEDITQQIKDGDQDGVQISSTQQYVQAMIRELEDAEQHDLTTLSQFQREERDADVFRRPPLTQKQNKDQQAWKGKRTRGVPVKGAQKGKKGASNEKLPPLQDVDGDKSESVYPANTGGESKKTKTVEVVDNHVCGSSQGDESDEDDVLIHREDTALSQYDPEATHNSPKSQHSPKSQPAEPSTSDKEGTDQFEVDHISDTEELPSPKNNNASEAKSDIPSEKSSMEESKTAQVEEEEENCQPASNEQKILAETQEIKALTPTNYKLEQGGSVSNSQSSVMLAPPSTVDNVALILSSEGTKEEESIKTVEGDSDSHIQHGQQKTEGLETHEMNSFCPDVNQEQVLTEKSHVSNTEGEVEKGTLSNASEVICKITQPHNVMLTDNQTCVNDEAGQVALASNGSNSDDEIELFSPPESDRVDCRDEGNIVDADHMEMFPDEDQRLLTPSRLCSNSGTMGEQGETMDPNQEKIVSATSETVVELQETVDTYDDKMICPTRETATKEQETMDTEEQIIQATGQSQPHRVLRSRSKQENKPTKQREEDIRENVETEDAVEPNDSSAENSCSLLNPGPRKISLSMSRLSPGQRIPRNDTIQDSQSGFPQTETLNTKHDGSANMPVVETEQSETQDGSQVSSTNEMPRKTKSIRGLASRKHRNVAGAPDGVQQENNMQNPSLSCPSQRLRRRTKDATSSDKKDTKNHESNGKLGKVTQEDLSSSDKLLEKAGGGSEGNDTTKQENIPCSQITLAEVDKRECIVSNEENSPCIVLSSVTKPKTRKLVFKKLNRPRQIHIPPSALPSIDTSPSNHVKPSINNTEPGEKLSSETTESNIGTEDIGENLLPSLETVEDPNSQENQGKPVCAKNTVKSSPPQPTIDADENSVSHLSANSQSSQTTKTPEQGIGTTKNPSQTGKVVEGDYYAYAADQVSDGAEDGELDNLVGSQEQHMPSPAEDDTDAKQVIEDSFDGDPTCNDSPPIADTDSVHENSSAAGFEDMIPGSVDSAVKPDVTSAEGGKTYIVCGAKSTTCTDRDASKGKDATDNVSAGNVDGRSLNSVESIEQTKARGLQTYEAASEDTVSRKRKSEERNLSQERSKKQCREEPDRRGSRPDWSLVASGLRSQQKVVLTHFVKALECQQTAKFTHQTTHIIVGTLPNQPRTCQRTLKFMQGVAKGCWVLNFQWVQDCIQQRKILPEDLYEIEGDDSSELPHFGPQKGRTATKLLLREFEVCCYGTFMDLTMDDLRGLLTMCGATYAPYTHDLLYDVDMTTVVVVDTRTEDDRPYVVPAALKELKKVFIFELVSLHWLLDSIAQYTVMPLRDYHVAVPK